VAFNIYRTASFWMRRMDPETAHDLTLWALRQGLGPRARKVDDKILQQRLWGRTFPNPVGLSAGFDKNARVIGPMLDLGFGFVEIGSVTPRPQSGNPKPRLFRLPLDEAVINRLGFNNDGRLAVAERLEAWRATGQAGVVGVNLGKNKDSEDAAADYVAGAEEFERLADYLVVNVSSPNTPGLRALQGREELDNLLARIQIAVGEVSQEDRPPLLLKIAPDLTEKDKEDIAAVALERRLDGMIVSNSTITRPEGLRGGARKEAGGLSGKPLASLANQVLADMYRLTGGELPLVGVGGIASAADAYARVRAGASLVQLYTALIYQGPGLVARIKEGMAERLKADGFKNVGDAVGADLK